MKGVPNFLGMSHEASHLTPSDLEAPPKASKALRE